jgi:hypothetical protein
MCLIAYLILGLIAGWFVASQGVGHSGGRAPAFRGDDMPQVPSLRKSLNRFGAKIAGLVIER